MIEMLPILAPMPPVFPAPPKLPKAPVPPLTDHRGLVRELARKLSERKRDEVVLVIENLGVVDRDKLEAALLPTLSRDKLKPQGVELRRIIRFVRHKPKPLGPGLPFTIHGGKEAVLRGNKLSNGGTVTARTGVSADLGGGKKSNEAYSIAYEGPDTADMRWLQMIWREVVQEFPAKGSTKSRAVPVKRRLDNPSGATLGWYLSTHPDRTKDSSKRRWNADSPSGTSPFYEAKSPVKREGSKLTMIDFPSAMPTYTLAGQLFGAPEPPKSVIAKFHAETYLVHGMDVVYRVTVDITWTIGSDLKEPPGKISVSGARASGLSGPQRACLAIQHPEVDYLPGPPIPAPLADDEFDPVLDLVAGDWRKNSDDLERYEDVADVARAEFIRDVTGRSSMTINRNKPPVAGLNYDAKLGVEGATGFVDSKNVYHNPDMPADRDGPLPKVAIILGAKAFSVGGLSKVFFDKDYPVATLRHEMMHAAHNTLAIGWLVKWRDDFTALNFRDWLSKQRMPDLERKLVTTGIGKPFDLTTTELLGWTEGLVTAIPFLPAAPDNNLLKSKDRWPAALRELSGAGDWFTKADSTARMAALARIRNVICRSATPTTREVLAKWINVALDPTKLVPPLEQSTVTLVKSFFQSQTSWLKEVLDQVTKPCSK